MQPDAELLRLYLEARSEPAFTALVQRYLPLVYSAALRQVGGDPHRAQEVTQAVFTLLARKAGGLRRHPALSGWLYTSTHHVAAKLRRSEQRRWCREREAHAMPDPVDDSPTAADWEHLRPAIDEAMLQLKEEDRTAVLLRFFENRSYGDIGAQLSLSENAVRMRVERALDALRAALARRGVVSTAAALGGALSSHAITATPPGLAAAISTGAMTAAVGAGLTFFMSTSLIKTSVVTAVLVAGTAGLIYQQREIGQLRAANAQLQAKTPRPTTSLAAIPAEFERLQSQVAELNRSPAKSWQERANQLREMLQQYPELSIPEIEFATEEDWLDATKGELKTLEDYRRAMAKLRDSAIKKFVGLVQPALRKYLQDHGDQFPTDVAQLQPYLERPISPAIWQQYMVAPASAVSNVRMGGDVIITRRSAIDEDFDQDYVIGPRGHGSTSYGASAMHDMSRAFLVDHPGQRPIDPTLLRPYAKTQREKSVLERRIEKERSQKAN
ncbi:MAG: sigma-70 family RNA polymerase sigma factor [Opitutae bacterium]|nr:sigma-70 family RNA polymerase sigma factor [Opitutae bacterium]